MERTNAGIAKAMRRMDAQKKSRLERMELIVQQSADVGDGSSVCREGDLIKRRKELSEGTRFQ